MTLAAYLDELQRKRAAATQGEWRWGELRQMLYTDDATILDVGSLQPPNANDAALIAVAIGALDDLIAVARAAHELIQSTCASDIGLAHEELRAALDRLTARADGEK